MNGGGYMNPPTDPFQLLIYGIATVLVIAGLKLWDRRRDGRIKQALDETKQQATEAAQQAGQAAEHAGAAAAASGRLEGSNSQAGRQITAQTEELLQVGHDTNAVLLKLAMQVGGLGEQLRRLEDLPARVTRIEHHLDDLTYHSPARARRRQEEP